MAITQFTKPIAIPARTPVVRHVADAKGVIHVHCDKYDRDTILISFEQLKLMTRGLSDMHELACGNCPESKRWRDANDLLRSIESAVRVEQGVHPLDARQYMTNDEKAQYDIDIQQGTQA